MPSATLLCLVLTCVLGATAQAAEGGPKPRRVNPYASDLPKDVITVKDAIYHVADDFDLKLDLFLPREPATAPRPVVVWIHGGGWVGGKKGGTAPGRALVAQGFAVAEIDYRLSRSRRDGKKDGWEGKWPAQISDCRMAVRWLRTNAEKYQLDPERIGAWGSSAGGQLAAMLGTAAGDERLDAPDVTAEHKRIRADVQAVCVWFGATDYATKQLNYKNPEPAADPTAYVKAGVPPFLLFHGSADTLIVPADSEKLAKALAAVGGQQSLEIVPGVGHDFGGIDQEAANAIQERSRQFFITHLGRAKR